MLPINRQKLSRSHEIFNLCVICFVRSFPLAWFVFFLSRSSLVASRQLHFFFSFHSFSILLVLIRLNVLVNSHMVRIAYFRFRSGYTLWAKNTKKKQESNKPVSWSVIVVWRLVLVFILSLSSCMLKCTHTYTHFPKSTLSNSKLSFRGWIEFNNWLCGKQAAFYQSAWF